eukprot:CAMPEP_0172529190 /NCGR_PEP_ID=MMETSP1067-20121228/3331_1 /TAXON_ID=265564 ORGANISM="Thalassiosira punctigera, Strain Tpunct2005C2" /NCGR_SAMPLE_ID=MMETSP1067 /ASSEMBLY_ACC=CAM_ASM_000444 /LENGTH=499 /DNA_ID=CAMNT_0013313195 /DNA_START=127 /DNA_END=1626 /DNA_ORIENTATION=-
MRSGGTPVVVQGTAVASPYDHTTTATATASRQPARSHGASNDGRGEKQATRCRDPVFALLLYGNVAAIVAVAGIYGTEAFSDALDDSVSGYNYTGYIRATFILGALAIVLTGVSLPVMMCIPEVLIKVSLIAMLVLSGIMMVMSFLSGSMLGGIFGLIFFLVFVCYARAVWSRIPFASVNLVTACTAIKKNAGVIIVAYFFVALAFGWTILWSISLMGVWEKVVQSETTTAAEGYQQNPQQNNLNYGYLFLLFLSYFFTHQVIQNTMHVTVAGTVGSWWFSPEDATSFCSSGMCGSLLRSLTTSFGSICFGSLLVAIIQALKALAQQARQQENGILICIAECILGCLESILEYFNKWAFVYVGLYGYSYIEAGKNVFALFKNRGWEAIIADDLVGNVFFFLSLCIGGICAAIGLAFNEKSPEGWFDNSPNPGSISSTCAGLGFVAGLVLASILYSTIASAVNTVIVCFAEGPAEFEANHPELSRRMRETWLESYPDCGV